MDKYHFEIRSCNTYSGRKKQVKYHNGSEMMGITLLNHIVVNSTFHNTYHFSCFLTVENNTKEIICLEQTEIKNIKITDIEFTYNDNVQENEVIGYLKGYFGFTNEESIAKALIELKDILNGDKELPSQVSTMWTTFTDQFSKWFERKLKPCLEKELELRKMYYNMDIVSGS